MKTHDLGNVYTTRVPYLDKESPLLEAGWSAEIEFPYRQGRCLAVRVPFTRRGFALGWWGPEGDEEETLVKAAGVRLLGPTIIDTDPEI
jgi:hypothetical protein